MKPKAEHHLFVVQGRILVEGALAIAAEDNVAALIPLRLRLEEEMYSITWRDALVGVGMSRIVVTPSTPANENQPRWRRRGAARP
ncbi:MAG: hypothetical protein IT566_18245 [Rhodospirillaceae bacterium]|nr:hypothetical protein [Rhodospirillaceae bacterium]